MRRPNDNRERIQCRYFTWLLYSRKRLFYGDGRGNQPSLGRHSLGSSDRNEALAALHELDTRMAVRHGLAEADELRKQTEGLPLGEGRKLFEEFASRPAVTGGTRKSTQKRYRAVLDKLLKFAAEKKVVTWNCVDRRFLERYARHLEDLEYAPRSIYLELTVVKQILKWLIGEGCLPSSCQVRMKLARDNETSTYCWSEDEVQAMIEHCRKDSALNWIGDVLFTLAWTGMRISEVAQLRWSSVDLSEPSPTIRLVDETYSRRVSEKSQPQTLKGKRGRSFPIHAKLKPLLVVMHRHADGRVFHGPKSGRLKPDVVRRTLIREVIEPLKARFPAEPGTKGFEDGRLHSFRHYFCSCCANSGIPERVLMQWLGHTDAAMVRRYYHLKNDESQRQMDRLSPPDDDEADADGSAA